MSDKRNELLAQIWESQDEAYDLMEEYDSLPHHYGDIILYQAEAYFVNRIGQVPNITTTELAKQLNKTISACSQIVRKLVAKGLVRQERNLSNKRLYNLQLTEAGAKVYHDHIAFNEYCQRLTFDMLLDFTDEELETYLRIQNRINQAYQGDVARSKAYFGDNHQ